MGDKSSPPDRIPVSGIAVRNPEPAHTRLSCPKCGSRSFLLSEQWKTSIDFLVTDGWMDRANGNIDGNGGGGGTPCGVRGICGCGHEWTVRKASQIDNVIEEG